MYSVLFLIVYLANAVRSTENVTFETPEYILPCLKADPEINKCLVKTFNHLRPYLKEGIKDIDVPSLDPLTIDNLIMENGRGPFRIRAAFYNISTNGASNYSVGNIKTDLDNYVIEFGIHLPRLECKGKYDVNGNVLLFPVRSKGDFWAIFLDVNGAAKIFGKEFRNEKDVRFMKIDKMVVDFEMKKSRFRIKDIINHGNIIGEAMNQFLNNNADEIIAEMKPAANAAIAKHFKGFLNGAFVKLPLKVWLPDA
nr:circadian clock-controlled protein-like [Leptinotarsa decemlineata]